MTIEHNNSYSFQGESYKWPGGSPGDKPFPAGAFTYLGIKRLGAASFAGDLPDYQAIHMCNAETGGNTYNLEILIYGTGPLDGKIVVGGYDQVQPNEDHDTGITGDDRTKWIVWIFSWSGVMGEAARARWIIQGSDTVHEQPYDPPPKVNYARGDLAKVFSGYGAEQVIACESSDAWVFGKDFTTEDIFGLLDAGGTCPVGLLAYLDRHYPHATAADANAETVQDADAVPNGTAIDSANTPYPWREIPPATGSSATAFPAVDVVLGFFS